MTSPRTLLYACNLHPKKQLGQNFLSDPQTAEMIITRSKITYDDILLEIGAGLGALTIPAAGAAKKVYAVENDKKICELLKTELLLYDISNIEVINKGIQKVDIQQLAKIINSKITVIGNLPYNISSQILVKLIMERSNISRAILMFQKELADRIASQPGRKEYGRLSVMLQYCAEIRKIADVKASCFFPKPKVDSVVFEIVFNNRLSYDVDDEKFFFKVIKAAFSKRRKTLKNALSGDILNIDSKTAGVILNKAGIDPQRRAETLKVSEFVGLSNNLKRILR